MTIYAYNPATGELIRTDNVADWMGTTEVPPPDFDPVATGCFWRGGHWEIVVADPAPAPDYSAHRAHAYREESDPLFFQEQRGEVPTGTWLAKVAEIKARWPE